MKKQKGSLYHKGKYGSLKDGKGFNAPTKGKEFFQYHVGFAKESKAEKASNKA